ncbi:MAG TPA: PP2C family protein-serine/threonine phosphatase [bacterium]
MDGQTLDRFRRALSDNKDTLLHWLESEPDRKNVHLGGDDESKVLQLISDLKMALENIERGDFGKCTVCGDDVDTNLLEYDFTSSMCLSHYSNEQLQTLQRELELVSQVHRDLLPCKTPSLPGIAMAAHTESARIVGGDYYDFFDFRDHAQGIAIADVMDKGLPASMLMSNLQASLRILGPEASELECLAERLNRLFRRNLNLIKFISIFFGAIAVRSKTLTYCNAGHHPPLWWQATRKDFQWLSPTGPALGLTADPRYASQSITFAGGDVFVFYTDGLVEAGSNGEQFGEERLRNYVQNNLGRPPEDMVKGLLSAARQFAGRFTDDVTLMVVRIL